MSTSAMVSSTVSTTSELVVVSTTQTTTHQCEHQQHRSKATATSHDTEELLLGIKEAEWSKLLDNQSFLEPATSTESNLLENFSVGRQKESEGIDGVNSFRTSTKCKWLK